MGNRFVVALEQFKGTVVETMSKRANQNSDAYLDDVEFGIFTKDMEAMGMSFESLGLEVKKENVSDKKAQKALCQNYNKAFGCKGAELTTRADEEARLVIQTASNAFKNTHGFEYMPNDVLALRPKFTECKDANEYENKMIVWRGKMENAYKEFGQKSLNDYVKELQESISDSTSFLAQTDAVLALSILSAISRKSADIKQIIQDGDKKIIQVFDKQTNSLRSLITNSKDKIIGVTEKEAKNNRILMAEGFNKTIGYTEAVGKAVVNAVSDSEKNVKQNDNDNAAKIMNHTTTKERELEKVTTLVTQINSYITNTDYGIVWTKRDRVQNLVNKIAGSNIEPSLKIKLLSEIRDFAQTSDTEKIEDFEKKYNNSENWYYREQPKRAENAKKGDESYPVPLPPHIEIPQDESGYGNGPTKSVIPSGNGNKSDSGAEAPSAQTDNSKEECYDKKECSEK